MLKWVKAASGIMVSSFVLTAAPAEVLPWPVLASAFVAALRAVLIAFALLVVPVMDAELTLALMSGVLTFNIVVPPIAAGLTVVVLATAVPTGVLVVWLPLGLPPDVLTKISLSVCGSCQ